MKQIVAAIFMATLAATAAGQGSLWRDGDGRPLPETEARLSRDGFSGWLLVTSDQDWQAKWETPSHTMPTFNEARSVARGGRVWILTFFANPKLTAEGTASVLCDIEVARPDGTKSVKSPATECFVGRPHSAPTNVYLAAPVIAFVAEPGDVSGTWTVGITLKDVVRGVELPLKATFVLQ